MTKKKIIITRCYVINDFSYDNLNKEYDGKIISDEQKTNNFL